MTESSAQAPRPSEAPVFRAAIRQVASFGTVPGPEVFWLDRFDEHLPLVALMGVLRSERHTVVINSGPPLDLLPYVNARWVRRFGPRTQVTVSDQERTEAALASLGVTPEQVNHLIVTPLRFYAIGNEALFPNARVCLSRTGWIDFLAPAHPHVDRHLIVPEQQLVHLVTRVADEGRLHLLADDDELLPGLRVWRTGGHHASSMAISARTDAGTIVFTDAAFYEENIANDHPIGALENLDECRTAYARIRREADIAVPLYDPSVPRRFPDGYITRRPGAGA